MTVPNITIAKLNFVAEHLRVPELKYVLNAERESTATDVFFQQLYQHQKQLQETSLAELSAKLMTGNFLSNEVVNYAFIIDRSFDVWLRKLQLDSGLSSLLNEWRLTLLDVLVRQQGGGLENLLVILDRLTDLVSWSPHPERVAHLIPNELDSLLQALKESLSSDNIAIQQQNCELQFSARREKSKKVIERLVEAEFRTAKLLYSSAWAQAYINRTFANKTISDSLQQFLQQHWLALLAHHYGEQGEQGEQGEAGIPEQFIRLTKMMKVVFCDKGRGAFQYADKLIESLSDACEQANIEVSRSLWDSLADEAVAILQGQPLVESEYRTLTQFLTLENYTEEPQHIVQGDCYLHVETTQRVLVQAYFKDYAQLLLTNHLGVKRELMSSKNFSQQLQAKQWLKLPSPSLYSSVLVSNLKGLEKVAQTQLKARQEAAEKAQEEAEALQRQHQQAAEQAQKQAEEIAERAKKIAFKKEQAKRLDEEAKVTAIIAELNLGAWISVGSEKQRYKLAVKFAAAKKYVFVDKFGVKKLEFLEQQLVTSIIDSDVEILSDGADFDASLERVVSRIRIAK